MKKLILVFTLLISLLIPNTIHSENKRIVDNVGILSDAEINDLTIQLDELSNKYNYDIVIYFSNDNSFKDDIVSEGSEFFDLNGYGYGDNHNGILLIVNYETRYFDVITTGDEVRNKYDGYLQECCDVIGQNISDNPVYAISLFIDWVDTRFIYSDEDVIIDNPISEEELAKQKTIRDLSISAVISIIISAITMIVLKGQLKTEGKKHNASQYTVPYSFNLRRSGDIFLYRTTSRRYIPRKTNNNNSGNGFHISHTSSSGISHGSGGGHRF